MSGTREAAGTESSAFFLCSTRLALRSSVIGDAFTILGAKALFAGHNLANAASRSLLTRLGFVYTHDEYYEPTGLRTVVSSDATAMTGANVATIYEGRKAMSEDPSGNGPINLRSAAATVVAGILGAIAGAIAATRIPSDKFAWTGFALVPLLAILEILFKRLVGLFAGNAQATRVTLAAAIVVAFYASWFSLRAA